MMNGNKVIAPKMIVARRSHERPNIIGRKEVETRNREVVEDILMCQLAFRIGDVSMGAGWWSAWKLIF